MKMAIYFFVLSLIGCGHLRGTRPQSPLFSLLWVKNIDPSYNTGNLPIALNSPLIWENTVYVGDGKGYMGAYDVDNGRELWRERDGGTYHSGVVYFQGRILYGSSKGRIISRKAQTGELDYSVDVGASVEGHPHLSGGMIYFHLRDHKILCMDAQTGKILWAYRRSVPYMITTQGVSTPVVYKNKVYVGFADGTLAAFSAKEGVLLWEKKIIIGTKFVDVDTTPVVYQGLLVVGGGEGAIALINPKNGSLVRKLEYSISYSPLVYGENLLVGTNSGELVLLGPNFKELKKIKVSDNIISSLGLWKEKVVVPTIGEHLYLVDVRKNKGFFYLDMAGTYSFGHLVSAVFGRPSVARGRLALISSRHRIYVFE